MICLYIYKNVFNEIADADLKLLSVIVFKQWSE